MSMTDSNPPRVLVTGAGIAGPALAWGLRRAGFATTLLERAPQQRSAGQNVDIRGAGHEVLRRMGLRAEVAAAGTGELGTRFLRPDGSVYAVFPARPGEDGPTAELEILRGQLSALLLRATAGGVEHRYGDHLVEVAQDGDGVDVVTATGRRERYDLLVVAEGRRSRTRDLVLPSGSGASYHDLGQYVAYGTIDRAGNDDRWWRWLTATGRRVASLRPDNVGSTRATLAFMAPPMGVDRLDAGAQIRVLRERFAGVGWETPRILDGFAARPDEFYFERIEQVRVPRWSHGRVALVGDTAWGAPTGMGTTLALLGAHVLAGELATERDGGTPFDPARAFRAYEKVLRTHVERTQQLPPGVPGIALPDSRWGLRVLHGVHRLTATRALRTVAERALLSSASTSLALPEYPQLRASPGGK
ncbi:FAD-dependent monooxygenase [Winogradskya consettensis]|uniref:FAD-binding monooxygenase n=1 Tax=Winogradskya consettensis TaxID=113560 RepID=A0A919T3K1_9ACTN|nr:FAD-dependent monooxygenase [Actinoplanes consettensis]GIM83583.1 FAD-binding monooxygenase [Actinoplanes consettensis]